MKVLVVGGAGYIGCATVKQLIHEGHDVWVVDDFSNALVATDGVTNYWAIDKVCLGYVTKGSILDEALLDMVLRGFEPDVVLHLAAASLTGKDISDEEFLKTNVEGTEMLLACMEQRGIKKLVAASSCAVYKPISNAVTECSDVGPIGGYGKSKLVMESVICESGVDAVIFRYGNVVGAIDEFAESYETGRLIPMVAHAALTGAEFPVYGDDWPTSDGTCEIDLVYLADVVDVNVSALKRVMEMNDTVLLLNIGRGKLVSTQDVIEMTEYMTKKTINACVKERRQFDFCVCIDSAKARRELQWRPRHGLPRIVNSQVVWESGRQEVS